MRVDDGIVAKKPFAQRECCSNGHRWTPETTRWRKRNRGGRHGFAVERDCLVCKAVSEADRRRRKRISERNYR